MNSIKKFSNDIKENKCEICKQEAHWNKKFRYVL